jgi:hypothetical protein
MVRARWFVGAMVSVLSLACTAQTVALTHAAALRPGVDAWPSIDAPSTPAQVKINAKLAHLNQKMLRSLTDCDAGYNEALQQMGPLAKGQEPASKDTTRSILATMQGPRYLSLVANTFADCGGAHPNSDTEVMVFDMTTGAPINWLALIAKSAGASSYTDSLLDGTTAGAVVLPELSRLYEGAADKDCHDAFSTPQSFLIWPDAKKATLDVQAFDLSNGENACAAEMDVSLVQARKLGFSSVLLGAITAAHTSK